MSTILDIPEVRARVSRLSVEEFHRLPEFNERGRRTADLSIVRGREEDFRHAHPTTAELVVEVAVSSAALDRENASLYAEAGVKEYWLVLGREQQVEVYSRPDAGRYRKQRIVHKTDRLECRAVPGVRISVAELFG